MWWCWAVLAWAGSTEQALREMRQALDEAYERGNYAEAIKLAEQLADKTEEAYPGHAYALQNRANVAFMLNQAGRYDEAIDRYQTVLAEVERRDDIPWDVHTGLLSNLADAWSTRGDYPEAALALQEAMAVLAPVADEQPLELAWLVDGLCSIEEELGRYEQALPQCQRALALARGVLGPEDSDLGTFLSNTGMALSRVGRYEEARDHYEQAIAHWRQVHGDAHPSVAVGLNNLASLLARLGDSEQAQALLRQALAIDRATWPDGHPRIADVLDSLGGLADEQGAEAEALLEEALQMRLALFGPDHWLVALSMSNLAVVYGSRGEVERAVELLTGALEQASAHLGDEHPFVATLHQNLATALNRSGRVQEALVHAERAVVLNEALLGPQHPETVDTRVSWGAILLGAGDVQRGRAQVDEALRRTERGLELLDALSEREAREYLPKLRMILDTWLGAFDAPEDVVEAWQHVRTYKGALVARTRARRARLGMHPMLAADLDRAHDLARQRARLALASDPALRKRAESLRVEQEQLERQVGGLGASFAPVPLEELCAALPEDTALIDVVRFQAQPDQYIAFVVESDCRPQRVDLGDAVALDTHVRQWRALLPQPDALASRLRERGAPIASQLATPLLQATGARHWLFVPEGELATVPLGALPAAEGLLIDHVAVSYLDRADDLVRSPGQSADGLLLVGGVDYGAATEGACGLTPFPALPATAEEAATVRRSWRRSRRRREPVRLLAGEAAEESAVSTALEQSAIAHIATHGFAWSEGCGEADPMMRSGLALTGANAALGQAADGLLTATELAMLELSHTELLVLSACETGRGTLHAGRILGLRRAAAIAGVQSLVMSLWAVPDTATASLMARFYHHLHHRRRPLPPAAALRQAQLEALAEQRERGWVRVSDWAAFVVAGAPSQ